MAGINPIVTVGFLFTPSLVVTRGLGSATPVVLTTATYYYVAEDQQFSMVAETKPFTITAEDGAFELIAARERTV